MLPKEYRELWGIELKDIGLKNRSYNLLMRSRVDTVEKLLKCSPYELYKLPHMGAKTFEDVTNAIERVIREYGR